MSGKRVFVGLLLMLAPVLAVKGFKQTEWGPLLATPQARQTGDPAAKVVIVEYSDFQCPSCARMQPTIHQFFELYKGKIRLYFKYYPLVKIHKNAMPAAHAAECAAEQNKFWPYHDQLFATQAQWAPLANPTTNFMAIAQESGVDMERFKTCWADPSREEPAKRDAEEAKARGVTSTPTFFIGEERLVGGGFATGGARAMEKALRK